MPAHHALAFLSLTTIVFAAAVGTQPPPKVSLPPPSILPIAPGKAATPAASAGATAAVTQFLTARRDESGFPGVCAAWVGSDGQTHSVAVGLADAEANKPMTVRDRMLSGSIGKTYVATVALQLVVEKKLGLDAKVSDYLGERPWFGRLPNAADLTVRSLLNHTSGIPRYVFDAKFREIVATKPDREWKPEELLAFVHDAKPAFAVGEGWAYADTNYIVLGMVIEKITGAKYYAELKRRVLDRCGLKDTVPSDSRRIKGLIPGYPDARVGAMFGIEGKTLKDGVFVINPQFEWCGGGLACTTTDLANWARIYGAATHWPATLREQFLTGVPAKELGRDSKYGLGVIIQSSPHGECVGHSGFMPGYKSEMRYYPKYALAVAIQFNTDKQEQLGMALGGYLNTIAGIVVPAKTTIRKQGK